MSDYRQEFWRKCQFLTNEYNVYRLDAEERRLLKEAMSSFGKSVGVPLDEIKFVERLVNKVNQQIHDNNPNRNMVQFNR